MLSFRQHASRPIYISLCNLENSSSASLIAKRRTSSVVYGFTGASFPDLREWDTFIHILDEGDFRKLNPNETEVPVGDTSKDTYFLKKSNLKLPKKSVVYIVLSNNNYDMVKSGKGYPEDKIFKDIIGNINRYKVDKALPISIWKQKEKKKKSLFGSILKIAGIGAIFYAVFGRKR